MTTPKHTIHTTRTQVSVQLLAYTHSFLLRKAVPQTEEEWTNEMFIRGQQFAINFTRLFPTNMQQSIEDFLLKTPAKEGEPNNPYWMWWRIKYMQDDYNYIDNRIYQSQHFTYYFCKQQMLNDDQLEVELLNMLYDNQII